MSKLEKIGNQVVDANEPVKQGDYLRRVRGLEMQVAQAMRRITDTANKLRHFEDYVGRWVGRLDLDVSEQKKQVLALEQRIHDQMAEIGELMRRVEQLEKGQKRNE